MNLQSSSLFLQEMLRSIIHRKRKMVKLNAPSYKHDIMERFRVLIYVIKAGQKLADDHINAVNQLLRT